MCPLSNFAKWLDRQVKAEVTGQRANSNKWLRISVKAEVTGSESNSEFREYRTRIVRLLIVVQSVSSDLSDESSMHQ